MIHNNKPFNVILDAYANECFYLFAVMKSLANYPDIYNDDFTDQEGLLYATSFALLCERYIFFTTQIQGNYINDFNELHHILNVEMSLDSFIKELNKINTIITSDLKRLFSSEKQILSFFSAIFRMEEESEPFTGSYFSALGFFENHIA